jgi:hypothetical protein
MVKHIDHLFAFARQFELGIEQMEEIVLVTGCDRSRSWTNIVFLGGQAQASFRVKVVHSLDTNTNIQFSPGHVDGALLNQGPEGKVRWYAFKFATATDPIRLLHDLVPFRTYPRASAFLSEGFVSLAPSKYFQSVLKRRRVPLQSQRGTTASQTRNSYQCPQLRRYGILTAFLCLHLRFYSIGILFTYF